MSNSFFFTMFTIISSWHMSTLSDRKDFGHTVCDVKLSDVFMADELTVDCVFLTINC